jgi:glycosyltransferase involved in cell wall biosynthesis
MRGWLVNDQLSPLPGQRTLFNDLLEWVPGLRDMTGGYTDYRELPDKIEKHARLEYASGFGPDYVIRNATYFRPLDLKVPTISLLQDVAHGPGRATQIDVCRRSALTVFNSEWTRDEYPELHEFPHAVIPIGIDFERFNAEPNPQYPHDYAYVIPPWSICWIGSRHPIKGFTLLERLIRETDLRFCLVFKDDTNIEHPRVRCFNKVTHDELVGIIKSCTMGICTSLRETQHLAGIEMGACGLPLLTTNVGIYYDREKSAWGEVAEDFEFVERLVKVERKLHRHDVDWAGLRRQVRWYWEDHGFTQAACKIAWLDAIRRAVGKLAVEAA